MTQLNRGLLQHYCISQQDLSRKQAHPRCRIFRFQTAE